MSLIQIPIFDGGLVTNADPEDIDKTAAIVSTNFETDVPGKLVKRQGRAASVEISGDLVNQIVKWTSQDLAASIWVYYETQNDKLRKCAANFTSAADIKTLDATTTHVQINNFGRRLRFATGIMNKAGIYQKIDRKFFFGSKDLSGNNAVFDYDNAVPTLPGVWENQAITEIGAGAKAPGFYYYKFVPVFDGNQEHPLPEGFSFAEITNESKTLRVGLKVNKGSGSTGGVENFNPRITAIKVYRSYSATATGNLDPVFYHISTIPLSTKDGHEDDIGTLSVEPMDNKFYFSNLVNNDGVTVDDGMVNAWGSGNTFTIHFNATANDSGYEVDTSADFPTDNRFIMNNSWGTTDKFNTVWTLKEDDTQNNNQYYSYFNRGGFCGKNCVVNTNWAWHSGEMDGAVLYSASPAIEQVVIDSMDGALKLSDDLTQTSAFTATLTDGYRYEISSDDITIHFYDYALNDQSLHPLGNKTKVTVNHKYATYLGGRLFVGNVRLDPDGDSEDHQDWIIYSELLQPDVLPIVNYIQIKDSQGGQITGLGKHLGSLVVFMERGVYRLDVPSTDPSQFSLLEEEENFGCVAPNSIITIGSQTFFAGEDNAYVIDPGFSISPITEPIKDVYQGKSNLEQSRFFYDPKKSRMLCRFGSDKQNIYSFDIRQSRSGKAVWSQLDMGSTDVADLFAIDDNLDVYTITN